MIRNLTNKKILLINGGGQIIMALPPEGAIRFEEDNKFFTHDGIKIESYNGKKPVNLPKETKNTIFIVDEDVKCYCFEREDFVTLPHDAKKTEVGDSVICDRLIF